MKKGFCFIAFSDKKVVVSVNPGFISPSCLLHMDWSILEPDRFPLKKSLAVIFPKDATPDWFTHLRFKSGKKKVSLVVVMALDMWQSSWKKI